MTLGHVERLQQLLPTLLYVFCLALSLLIHNKQQFPPPSADYDNPIQMGEDLPTHWSSDIEINDLWNTPDVFEKILKFHSIPALAKYIRSRPLLCSTDIDGWRMKDLFHRIFLSSDPENESTKELVYDFLYIPWFKGEFIPEFVPEWDGSNLISLQKSSGVIRDIAPVDIWRRSLIVFISSMSHIPIRSSRQQRTRRIPW